MSSFDPTQYLEQLKGTAAFLRATFGGAPRVVLVLGSGLGEVVEDWGETESLHYTDIPHFPTAGVVGHRGRLMVIRSKDTTLAVLQGRVHFYEGYPLFRVVYAVRALALWGARIFLVTNAAGGINPAFQPGDLMLIRDHINLMGDNPLCGPNLDTLGPRFPDMTQAYDARLGRQAVEVASRLQLPLKEGVYVALKGPSYETPAEIQMCRRLGADAVGMSTVPEVIALNHMGRRVAGLSCITNMAAGMHPGRLEHEEVMATTERTKHQLARFLRHWIGELANG